MRSAGRRENWALKPHNPTLYLLHWCGDLSPFRPARSSNNKDKLVAIMNAFSSPELSRTRIRQNALARIRLSVAGFLAIVCYSSSSLAFNIFSVSNSVDLEFSTDLIPGPQPPTGFFRTKFDLYDELGIDPRTPFASAKTTITGSGNVSGQLSYRYAFTGPDGVDYYQAEAIEYGAIIWVVGARGIDPMMIFNEPVAGIQRGGATELTGSAAMKSFDIPNIEFHEAANELWIDESPLEGAFSHDQMLSSSYSIRVTFSGVAAPTVNKQAALVGGFVTRTLSDAAELAGSLLDLQSLLSPSTVVTGASKAYRATQHVIGALGKRNNLLVGALTEDIEGLPQSVGVAALERTLDGVDLLFSSSLVGSVNPLALKILATRFALDVVEVGGEAAADHFDRIFDDPPDFQYDEIYTPELIAFVSGIDPKLDDVINSTLNAGLSLEASVVALERYQAALIDFENGIDTIDQLTLQSDAITKFDLDYQMFLADQKTALDALIGDLPEDFRNPTPLSQAQLDDYIEELLDPDFIDDALVDHYIAAGLLEDRQELIDSMLEDAGFLAALTIDESQSLSGFSDLYDQASQFTSNYSTFNGVSAVPIPATAWLLASAFGLISLLRKSRNLNSYH